MERFSYEKIGVNETSGWPNVLLDRVDQMCILSDVRLTKRRVAHIDLVPNEGC